MNQLSIDFEPGLVGKYQTAMDAIRAAVYSSTRPMKAIAADMDISQSELSRKLAENPNDTRHFTVRDLEAYVSTTGDLMPIMYLVEKYLADAEQKQKAALAELTRRIRIFWRCSIAPG